MTPGRESGIIEQPGSLDIRPSPIWERILPTGAKVPFR
jgi:hypothetical protein